LGWGLGLERASRRVGEARARLLALGDRLLRDDPLLSKDGVYEMEGAYHPLGADFAGEYHLKTPSGHMIAIIAEIRSGPFGDGPNRVTFEDAGRSMTWPFEDLERGRKVDLRAMFPEAFR
jgi:hypothetical protein